MEDVSHEWLLATGSNLPPSLPREGWQTVRVGRPGKDRQGLPPPARPAIDEAMRAAHAPQGREKAASGAAAAPCFRAAKPVPAVGASGANATPTPRGRGLLRVLLHVRGWRTGGPQWTIGSGRGYAGAEFAEFMSRRTRPLRTFQRTQISR